MDHELPGFSGEPPPPSQEPNSNHSVWLEEEFQEPQVLDFTAAGVHRVNGPRAPPRLYPYELRDFFKT